MKRILLVYLPFCTPASPPYSLTNIYSFLKKNSKHHIDLLDLNLEFHKQKFPGYQKYCHDPKNWVEYDKKMLEYSKLTSAVYRENNAAVVKDMKPEFFDDFLKIIASKKPDIIAFSIVYSSQAFYAYALMKELKMTKIIGGPAVNEKLMGLADKTLCNELELLEFIEEKKLDHNKLDFDYHQDFSGYDLGEYFTPEPVIPIKTTSTCYYKGCAFCSHYTNIPYFEYEIKQITKTIISSKQKHFFVIDDMIPVKRLLELADAFTPLKITWTCQLKPTKELTLEVLKKLKASGLNMLMWGIESGNDRILKLMNKGTNRHDIEGVLRDSHEAGIKNIAYIVLGFPTETKAEFLETIDFLKTNSEKIDLVNTSIFGLQRGTIIYKNPARFGITKIIEEERTVLEPIITYELSSGLSQEEARKLRGQYKRTIEKINKFPKAMNFFREHMLCRV